MSTWRGMSAVCWPHGHCQVVRGPSSLLIAQRARLSARLTSRRRIPFATPRNLYPLDMNIKPGLTWP